MIRKATIDDAAAIARIHVNTWRVAYKGIVPADFLANLSEEKRIASWEQQIRNGVTVMVAVIDSDMVGWISAGPSRDPDAKGESEIYAIYISPQHWGNGIGRRLMESIETTFPASPATTLWVLRENQNAITFYEHLGFAKDGTQKDHQFGAETLQEIRMRKNEPNKSLQATATAA